MKYRSDIDGLRAVAVLPVLLYHVGLPGVSGGYVGVDVFFVISGFLITKIITGDIEAGRFSFLDFYERRIRRLFPALFSVIIASGILGSLILYPKDFVDFSASVVSSTLFYSNLYFSQTADYFGGRADTKPLLHMWSLAVEEQFYIFFPILLIAVSRWFGKRWMTVLAIGAALSFTLSTWGVSHAPGLTFYLLPTRAWELALGAMLALPNAATLRSPLLREAAAGLGLLLIGWAVFTYDGETPFPGPAAALPCVGAALIIWAGSQHATAVGRVLSSRPVVFIGLISYSLYLWHWPLIVFLKYWSAEPLALPQQLGLIAVSILIAWLSWRYIEQPFRKRTPNFGTTPIFALAASLMVLSTVLGASGWLSQKRFMGFDAAQQELLDYETADYARQIKKEYRIGSCFVSLTQQQLDKNLCLKADPGKPNYLLLGDSIAASLWPGLQSEIKGVHFLQATGTGCRGLYLADRKVASSDWCDQVIRDAIEQFLPANRIDGVLLSSLWREEDIALLRKTLLALKPLVPNVILAGPTVVYEKSLPSLGARAAERSKNPDQVAIRHVSKEAFSLDAKLRRVAVEEGVQYLSLLNAQCPNSKCQSFTADRIPYKWDTIHFTVEGSRALATELLKQKIFIN